jgi:hypothetical protein
MAKLLGLSTALFWFRIQTSFKIINGLYKQRSGEHNTVAHHQNIPENIYVASIIGISFIINKATS